MKQRLSKQNQSANETSDSGKATKKNENSTRANLAPGWTRTTTVVREDHLDKLKALAWWERASTKDVLEQILDKFFSSKEVPPIPKEKKIKLD